MIFSDRNFMIFLIASIMLHLFATTILFAGKKQEKMPEFKEIKIRLGSHAPERNKVVEIPQSRQMNEVAPAAGLIEDVQPVEAAQPSVSHKTVYSPEVIEEKLPEGQAELKQAEQAELKPQNAENTQSSAINSKEKQEAKEPAEAAQEVAKEQVAEKNEPATSEIKQPVIAKPKPQSQENQQLNIASLPLQGSVVGNDNAEEISGAMTYEQLLPLWMERFKFYPAEAKGMNLQGKGIVRITIKRDGKILYKEIEEGTGEPLLDKALMRMMADADPVIPVPTDYYPDKKTLSYRMRFELRE